jgi:hypothetical protein
LACCCDHGGEETRRFLDRQVSTKGTEKAKVEALSLAYALYWLVYRHDNQISVVIEPEGGISKIIDASSVSGSFALVIGRCPAERNLGWLYATFGVVDLNARYLSGIDRRGRRIIDQSPIDLSQADTDCVN